MSSSGLSVMSNRTVIEKRYIIDLPYEAGGLEEDLKDLAAAVVKNIQIAQGVTP